MNRIESVSALPAKVAALALRIPHFTDVKTIYIEPLQNVISLNNANYRVIAEENTYVLRVASDDAKLLGVRRDEELAAARAAAEIGVAPQILYAEPEGHFLTPFIAGRHWEQSDFREEKNRQRLAQTLKRLHAVTDLSSDGFASTRIERLLESAAALNLELPANIEELRKKMRDVDAMRRADDRFPSGLTHNDLWANNFLDDGERLWLLDWEFSGNGDCLIDIATVTMAGGFNEDEQRDFLALYGYDRPDDLKILDAVKFHVLFFEAAWAMVQHALRGSADFDYLTHSRRMFDRL